LGGGGYTTATNLDRVGLGFEVLASNGSAGPSTVIDGGWKMANTNTSGFGGVRSSGTAAASQDWTMVARVSWPDPGSGTNGFMFGLLKNDGGSPVEPNQIGWRIVPGGNIEGFVDSGGSETTRDSGQAGEAAEHTLRTEISSGGGIVKFFFDNSQVGANVTTNIPSTSTLIVAIGAQGKAGGPADSFDVADVVAWRDV